MRKYGLIIAVFSFLLVGCTEKTIFVHMQPKVGSEYKIETQSEQLASMNLYGQEIQFEQKIRLEHQFSVDSVLQDSSMVMTGHLSKVHMEVMPKSNKGIVTSFIYDSENEKNNKGNYKAYSYIFNKLINQSYRLQIGVHGDVISNSKNALINQMGLDTIAESKNALEDDFTTLFAVLPLGSIKEGSIYSRTISSGNESKVSWMNEYLVEKIEEKEIKLSVDGNISNAENTGVGNDFKGHQSGNIIVDRISGMVKSSEIDLELEVISKEEAGIQPKIKGKVTYVCTQIK